MSIPKLSNRETTKKPPEGGGGGIRSVIYRILEALSQDRLEALCLERGSRNNVGGGYREGIRTI